jgi:hypothetical protein
MSNEYIPPVIINGMFRSGTSLLWRVLKADRKFLRSFYEPFHPEPFANRPLNIAKPYFQEKITDKWSEKFATEKIHLKKDDSYPELKDYLDNIIKENSLIKFTRLNLRLEWFLANFPEAFVINIIRDPRDVCLSFINRGYLDFSYWSNIKQNYRKLLKGKPSIYYYREYLKSMRSNQKWKQYIVNLQKQPEYIKILGLWRINIVEVLNTLNSFEKSRYINIKHEDFCYDPTGILDKIYRQLNIKKDPKVEEEIFYPNGNENIKIKGHKFHMEISANWINQWKKKDKKIWSKGIHRAGIDSLMRHFEYELV